MQSKNRILDFSVLSTPGRRLALLSSMHAGFDQPSSSSDLFYEIANHIYLSLWDTTFCRVVRLDTGCQPRRGVADLSRVWYARTQALTAPLSCLSGRQCTWSSPCYCAGAESVTVSCWRSLPGLALDGALILLLGRCGPRAARGGPARTVALHSAGLTVLTMGISVAGGSWMDQSPDKKLLR